MMRENPNTMKTVPIAIVPRAMALRSQSVRALRAVMRNSRSARGKKFIGRCGSKFFQPLAEEKDENENRSNPAGVSQPNAPIKKMPRRVPFARRIVFVFAAQKKNLQGEKKQSDRNGGCNTHGERIHVDQSQTAKPRAIEQ